MHLKSRIGFRKPNLVSNEPSNQIQNIELLMGLKNKTEPKQFNCGPNVPKIIVTYKNYKSTYFYNVLDLTDPMCFYNGSKILVVF